MAVFLDGLGADALGRMPFLSSQTTTRRVRTELGYSITCHASMYTGLRPDRHHRWFVWQRGPGSSPFRWLRPLRFLSAIDSLALRVGATKVTRRFVRTTSWFGVPYPVHVPWKYLPLLDISERRLWTDPGYVEGIPTIFDQMRAAGVSTQIVGMAKRGRRGLQAIQEWQPQGSRAQFTYLFAGDIDHASHQFGQGSSEVSALLARTDALIAEHFRVAQQWSPNIVLVVWSDHGHHDVQRLDPFQLLTRHEIDLSPYLHVIDTNFIRVWVSSDAERRSIVARLDAMGVGHVLSEADLDRYRCRMPDDRYGNVIFYLDVPYAFDRTIWGYGRNLASAHGYLPDHPRSDGIFISSLPARDGVVDLVDVAPSLLAVLELPIQPGLDGQSVWDGPEAS